MWFICWLSELWVMKNKFEHIYYFWIIVPSVTLNTICPQVKNNNFENMYYFKITVFIQNCTKCLRLPSVTTKHSVLFYSMYQSALLSWVLVYRILDTIVYQVYALGTVSRDNVIFVLSAFQTLNTMYSTPSV
jgi:hypothetical protein